MAKKIYSATDERIMDLCEKIVAIYSKDDIRRLVSFDPYTLDRCAMRTNVLRPGNAMGVASILAVRDQTLKDYYDQKITLDELWEKRGESPKVNVYNPISFEDILYHAKNLNESQRLEMAKAMLETLNLTIKDKEQSDINTETFLDLSEQSKKRFKTLLNESLRYRKLTVKDLIENGCNAPAVNDITGDFTRQYTLEVYQGFLPYLYSVLEWIDDEMLVIAYPQKIETMDELLKELLHS